MRPYPIVSEPRYAFMTMGWSVKMSDGSVKRFPGRYEALAFIARNRRPSLKAFLSASVKETGT